MKITHSIPIGLAAAAAGLLLTGCATDPNRVGITNPNQPGPAVGQALGLGVGAVGGNVVGGVVGFGEGVVGGAKAPFDNTTRVIRRWRTETTPDGRTIQVPEDIVVDATGRPVGQQPRN
ncbi:hypothetical protein LBMAG56_54200 [Verrucomicrobiota bacterium]|nr:hypothetical protein LBMAG56_54200 [Verrucomicrobiota bacterium]